MVVSQNKIQMLNEELILSRSNVVIEDYILGKYDSQLDAEIFLKETLSRLD